MEERAAGDRRKGICCLHACMHGFVDACRDCGRCNLVCGGMHHAVQHIFEGLGINRSLQWLSLGGNSLGADGARFIAQGLTHNHTLLWLALGGELVRMITENVCFAWRVTACVDDHRACVFVWRATACADDPRECVF